MSPFLNRPILAAIVALAGASGVSAQDASYAGPHVQATEYGYGGPVIRGEYIGAPLTRFPRPTELVPSAWGYGTYGVPTVTGIRPASVGTPTVYEIESRPAQALRRPVSQGPRVLSRGRGNRWSDGRVGGTTASPSNGARVIVVTAPRRHTASR